MFRDYKNRKFEDFLYSPATDILINWGRAHILRPEYLQETEDEWNFLKKKSDTRGLLETGTASLEKDTEDALNFLHGQETLDLYDDMAIQAQTALEILDNAVMLSEAVEFFPDQSDFSEDFTRKADHLLQEITIDCEPPSLRLIPINRWRREVLQDIPAEFQYLFPWYVNWSELPPETLEILIQHWKDIENNQLEMIETDSVTLDGETLYVLLTALTKDHVLLNHIRHQSRTAEVLSQAVKKDFKLQLLLKRNSDAPKYFVSDEVEDKGLYISACKNIDTRDPLDPREVLNPLRSKEDRTERLFLAAFCGPGLTDEKRIDLFGRVENNLDRLDFSKIKSDSPLKLIDQWKKQGDSQLKKLSDIVLESWLDNLTVQAKKVAEPVPNENISFLDTVNRIMTDAIVEPTTVLTGFIEWIKNFCASELYTEAAKSAGPLSKESVASQDIKKSLNLDKNIFEDDLYIEDDSLKIRDDSPLQQLDNIEYYWNGWYEPLDGDMENIYSDAEEGDITPSFEIGKDKEYKTVVVCIATDEEIVNTVVSKINSKEEPLPEEKKNTIWLIYTKK
ncbi:type III-E CRISPR-associated protein Csx30 [Desulfonema magnum]|uniref:Uncharacterized protein n=1 Tax=Desulfonema magnum TaxID=45655 RepID=A0A975BSK5_9BACT|nr:type III-E CRISPR-associated protein Csx30 [Desulfonema magnum]QTA90444.1 Uncharacterized protein dnm_065050 [Desulfonema magnum]